MSNAGLYPFRATVETVAMGATASFHSGKGAQIVPYHDLELNGDSKFIKKVIR